MNLQIRLLEGFRRSASFHWRVRLAVTLAACHFDHPFGAAALSESLCLSQYYLLILTRIQKFCCRSAPAGAARLLVVGWAVQEGAAAVFFLFPLLHTAHGFGMTCKLVTMTTSKLLRHAAAAAAAVLVLGTLQGPSEPSNRVGFIGVNLGQIWAVEAAGSNGQDDEEDQSSLGGSDGEGSAGSDASQSNAKNSSIKQASENGEQVDKDEVNNMDHNANGGDSRKQSNLRGSVTNSITPLPLPGKNLIESIFGSLADVAKVRRSHIILPPVIAISLPIFCIKEGVIFSKVEDLQLAWSSL